MSKILFLSNTSAFSRFNLPFMRWFRQRGWQVDYASDGKAQISDCDNQYRISIKRTPYSLDNFRAYKELKNILKKNEYDIIHCHTPMGGVLGRFASKNIKAKTKIIYTAHGFHFYKGAPLINWLFYYPVEKYLAKYTDILITINEEDYDFAKKRLSTCKNIFKISGVGVDLEKFKPCNEEKKHFLKSTFGFDKKDFIILYIAEFISRKNHRMLIDAIKELSENIKQLKIMFVGVGPLLDKYKKIIYDSNLSEAVLFLGHRTDVEKLCNIADLVVSPSKQEGLPIGILECLVSGLPVICSKIRGHVDVIANGKNGLLFDLNNSAQMIDAIIQIYNNLNLKDAIIQNNLNDRNRYSLDIAIVKMAEIYIECM